VSLNTIIVSPTQTSGFSVTNPAVRIGSAHAITPAKLRQWQALPHAQAAYAAPSFLAQATAGHRSLSLLITALPPRKDWAHAALPHLSAGKWPTTHPAGIALPQSLAQALYGLNKKDGNHAAGRSLSLRLTSVVGSAGSVEAVQPDAAAAHAMKVSGVLANQLGNTEAYVSYQQAIAWIKQAIPGPVHFSQAVVVAQSAQDVKSLAQKIHRQGYGTTTAGQIVGKLTKSFGILETGLGVIGGVALAVAGLMIAVVMSMSVLERRKEIGVLRAIGARQRDIFGLFLTEAALIGLSGGIVGDGIGWGLGLAGNAIFHTAHLFLVQPGLLGIGIGFGTGIAALAGWWPAHRAAQLNPIDALRSD
ncbi:MAG: ABC transporter permease, partial [Firmicutes bacterium]|nr:ABC transporter permease [Bacillota bacterium]